MKYLIQLIPPVAVVYHLELLPEIATKLPVPPTQIDTPLAIGAFSFDKISKPGKVADIQLDALVVVNS
jgi:hypothetical protein